MVLTNSSNLLIIILNIFDLCQERCVDRILVMQNYKLISHLMDLLSQKWSEILPDGKLTIFIEITVWNVDNETINSHGLVEGINDPYFRLKKDKSGSSRSLIANVQGHVPPFKFPDFCWKDDLFHMIEHQKFSDITLSVCGRPFHAHQNLLSARSPVFQAMLTHDMYEKKEKLIKIVDAEPMVFEELLRYIYTGKAPNLESMAAKLMEAADKYGLDRLKTLCEVYLGSNLTVDNAAEVLVLADMHNAQRLKSFAINYINTHSLDVMDSQGWKVNLIQHPNIITDLFLTQIQQDSQPCLLILPFQTDKNNIDRYWCKTKFITSQTSFKWTIDKLSLEAIYSGTDMIKSSVFYEKNRGVEWRLAAQFSEDDEIREKYLAIYLELHSPLNTKIKSIFSLSLLDNLGEKFNTSEHNYAFIPRYNAGNKRFLRSELLFGKESLLQNCENLTILCEIIKVHKTFTSCGIINNVYEVPDCTWAKDIGTLFESQEFSDVILTTGNKRFPAHKNILAASSSVFAAMFKNKSDLNIVEINDIEAAVLNEMLNFIYTDQSPNLDSLAEDLLYAADKYGLENLKVVCEESLATHLTVKKAAEILLLADRCKASQLMSFIINFIVRLPNRIIKDWFSKFSSHPHIINEFYKALAHKRIQLNKMPINISFELATDIIKSQYEHEIIQDFFL
ncbi:SPOPL [Cordylochernes scorpioides]|uniref:SPOPL n=1 Tax=Cordylochernes scorpioides TaxID=51811 RepID=A0ABY6KLG9_9ARAC|nr:SPOPL [Cordylochernes scorpioides]